MFGLGKSNAQGASKAPRPRRSADRAAADAEVSVLKALHNAARRSSPHRAAVRAEISRGIAVVEAATMGLSHIRELVDEVEGLCRSARESDSAAKRALIAERYEAALAEIDAIARATGHSGVNLIDESNATLTLRVTDGQDIRISLPHVVLTAGSRGLAMPRAARAFASDDSLTALADHLGLARNRLDKAAALFRDHASDLCKRLAFVLNGTILSAEDLKNVPDGPLPKRV